MFSLSLLFGRSGLRPSLVRGDSPRNAPSKTSTHRLCVVFTTVRADQRGVCRPNTKLVNLNGGGDEALVETDAVSGLVFAFSKTLSRSHWAVAESDELIVENPSSELSQGWQESQLFFL